MRDSQILASLNPALERGTKQREYTLAAEASSIDRFIVHCVGQLNIKAVIVSFKAKDQLLQKLMERPTYTRHERQAPSIHATPTARDDASDS